MQNMTWLRLGLILASIGVFICRASTPLCAFDTGHHHDLTHSAMKTLGFNAAAIKTAQLENWLVDYFSSQPLAGLDGDLVKLHFDNLDDSKRVQIYWQHFRVNSKTAFEQAARDRDSLRVVALLGMSLHAAQDFYSHSDWVEQHALPASGYSTDTYFDNPILAAGSLRTGNYPNQSPYRGTDHGDGANGTAGMNHDAYTRPRWDRAYVHAFCASRQWIAAARIWVESIPGGDAVWRDAQRLTLSSTDAKSLDRDLAAAYRISAYAPGGHWKGPGSDSKLEFAGAVARFAGGSDSIFVKHFKDRKWHQQLTDGLELTTAPSSDPSIPPMTHPFFAVQVRTLGVEELPIRALEPRIDAGGKPDFFAKLEIDGQPFIESMQRDQAAVRTPWRSIAFVLSSQSEASIRYELWDEDGGASGDDDLCDIGAAGRESGLNLTFSLNTEALSGDIQGQHQTEATVFESAGEAPDKNRAKVRVSVSKAALNP